MPIAHSLLFSYAPCFCASFCFKRFLRSRSTLLRASASFFANSFVLISSLYLVSTSIKQLCPRDVIFTVHRILLHPNCVQPLCGTSPVQSYSPESSPAPPHKVSAEHTPAVPVFFFSVFLSCFLFSSLLTASFAPFSPHIKIVSSAS